MINDISEKLNKTTKSLLNKIIDQDYKFYIQVFNDDVPTGEIRLHDLKYISVNDLMVKLREYFYKYNAVFKLENTDGQIKLSNNEEMININFILEKNNKYFKLSNELEQVIYDYINTYSSLFVSVISNDIDKLIKTLKTPFDYNNLDKKYIMVWAITEGKHELVEELIPIVDNVVFEKAVKEIEMETLELFDRQMAKIINQRLNEFSRTV